MSFVKERKTLLMDISLKTRELISKHILYFKERAEVKRRYKGLKPEPLKDFMDLVYRTYLKENVYKDASKSCFNMMTEPELLAISEYLDKNFKYKYPTNLSRVRFYMISNNSEHLFSGYNKRLMLINFIDRIRLNKYRKQFYNKLFQIVEKG